MTEQGTMKEQRTMTEQEINGGARDDNREGRTMTEWQSRERLQRREDDDGAGDR